jgi:hypothetical protein
MSNRKPLLTNRKTSPSHSKVPIAEATAGKLYRVRDKDWVKVWGYHLTWAQAVELKNRVVAKRLSRTARVEDMAIPMPDNASASAAGGTAKTARVNQASDDGVDDLIHEERAQAAELATLLGVGSEPTDDDIDDAMDSGDHP